MSHDLRNALQVYLDVPAVRLLSDCVLCSRMWSTARRVSRGRSVTSLQMSGFGVKTVLRRPVGSLAPQRPTHELVQGMNAPSWLIHRSSHRSLPLFSLLTSGYARMPATYRPARYATAARHALATQRLRLPPSNLFRQCTMEMWANGRWRHQRGFFSPPKSYSMWGNRWRDTWGETMSWEWNSSCVLPNQALWRWHHPPSDPPSHTHLLQFGHAADQADLLPLRSEE